MKCNGHATTSQDGNDSGFHADRVERMERLHTEQLEERQRLRDEQTRALLEAIRKANDDDLAILLLLL